MSHCPRSTLTRRPHPRLTTNPHFASQLGGVLDLAAKFVRLTRIFRLIKLSNHLASARLLRICMLTVGLTFFTHWLACAWWALGTARPPPPGLWPDVANATQNGMAAGTSSIGRQSSPIAQGEYAYGVDGISWVYRLGVQSESLGMQYLAAFYFAIT